MRRTLIRLLTSFLADLTREQAEQDEMLALTRQLVKDMHTMQDDFDKALAADAEAIAAQTDVIASATTAFTNLNARLTAALNDAANKGATVAQLAAVSALRASIEKNTDALAAAIPANTSAAPPADPAPAPAPAPADPVEGVPQPDPAPVA